MSKPMLLADFIRLPPAVRGYMVEGLAAAIDIVAERGAPSHRFLRFGWYAAALAAYGGAARTLVVEEDDTPVVTLPFIVRGLRLFRIAEIPGCPWPFRSFGLALGAGDAALRSALATLAGAVNGLRIGPAHADDPAVTALIAIARAQGWGVLDRPSGRATMMPARPDDRVFWQAAVTDPMLARMIRTAHPATDAATVEIDTGEDVYVIGRDAAVPAPRSDKYAPTREWLLLRPGLPAFTGRLFGWVWQHRTR
jgi:hypothetical protein